MVQHIYLTALQEGLFPDIRQNGDKQGIRPHPVEISIEAVASQFRYRPYDRVCADGLYIIRHLTFVLSDFHIAAEIPQVIIVG